MDTITSTSNQYVKLARSLSEKKFRDQTGLFLVEGANILRDMPLSEQVEFFLIDEEKQSELEKITNKFFSPVFLLSSKIFGTVCDTVSPQGIVAVVKKNEHNFALPTKDALVLDKVADAGNLGTILRTAAAADFTSIYLLECADVYSPKVVRASMGGIFKVDCYTVNEQQAISVIEATSSFALDMDGKSLLELEKSPQITLVGGSEAHGVRESILNASKQIVSIPMKNQMESLNVAVALAIAMYKTI